MTLQKNLSENESKFDTSYISSIVTLITFISFVIIYTNLVLKTDALPIVSSYIGGTAMVQAIVVTSFFSPTIIGIIYFFKLVLFLVINLVHKIDKNADDKWFSNFYTIYYFSEFFGMMVFTLVISFFVAVQSNSYMEAYAPSIRNQLTAIFGN